MYFIVLKNINSTASETIVNYLNILNLDNLNNNNVDINHLYFLVKFFFKNPEKSPLLKMFNDNNYKFFFIGNQWLNCNNLETTTCLPFEKNNKKLFNLYLIKSFLGSTPLKDFIVLLRDQLHNNTFLLSSEANAFYDNDAINKLINNFPYLDNNKYFFFAHHLSPHDCQILLQH